MNNLINHINHSKLDFASGAGVANVNIYTGRLLFVRPDMSMGGNSFAVNVSHVYDSQPNEMIEPRMGNGWKLNIQQYLIAGNENVFYYVDESGYTHEFERYSQSSDTFKYYDKLGTGLTLWVKPGGERYIEDPAGGRHVFDAAGRLIEISTPANARVSALRIVKKIVYDGDGKLISVYDSRKSARRIRFTYGDNNLLADMECYENGIKSKIYYYYDANGNLMSQKEYANASERYTAVYSYEGNALKCALRVGNGSSLRFDYDSAGRVAGVANGLIKTELQYSQALPALFASDSAICGTDKYCGQTERRFLGYSIADNGEDMAETGRRTIDFGSTSTCVKNERGIEHEYFFNKKGFTTGVLERDGSDNNALRTLTKDAGVRLVNAGYSINRSEEIVLTKVVHDLSFDDTSNSAVFSRLQKYITDNEKTTPDENETRGLNYHVLSFWVKLSDTQKGDLKVNVTTKQLETKQYHFIGGFSEETVAEPSYKRSQFLDATATEVWQYVTVPVFIETYVLDKRQVLDGFGDIFRKYLSGLYLDFEGLTGDISIADLRLSPGQSPETLIYGKTLDNIETIEYLADGIKNDVKVGSEFFMTETDYLQTFQNKAYSADGKFDLVACGGTKRIANVTNLSTGSSNNIFEWLANIIATVVAKPYAVVNSSQDDKIKTVSAISFEGEDIYQETKTYLEDELKSTELKITDRYGKILSVTDAYGVKTSYSYDAYGNPTTAIVQNTAGGDLLQCECKYDDEELPEKREHVIRINDNGTSVSATYNSPFSTLDTVRAEGSCSTKYEYDAFARIVAIYSKNGSTTLSSNNLEYTEDDKLKCVTDQAGRKNEIEYDRFGLPVKFYENDVLLVEKEYTVNETIKVPGNSIQRNADKVTEKRYRADNADETEIYADKYGRPLAQKNGEDVITYRYQDDGNPYLEGDIHRDAFVLHTESPSCAKLTSLYDPFEKQTYIYHYDDRNRACGYTSTGSTETGARSVTVRQTSSDKTEYYLGTDKDPRLSQITTDGPEGGTTPRIMATTDGDANSNYRKSYNYDSLGRLHTVNTDAGGLKIAETKNYKPGTSLLSSLEHKIESNSGVVHMVTQKYDHNNNGNLLSITETSYGPVAAVNSVAYGYDTMNRLTSENSSSMGDYLYHYDANTGNLDYVEKNSIRIKSFVYANGKRTSVNGNSIGYDRQGNVTGYLNKTFGYDSRGNITGINENSYAYNSQNIRYKKTVGGVTTYYYLDGDKILGEDRGIARKLRYYYGADGIAGVYYDRHNYTFARDGAGNVCKIFSNVALICEYKYDAWGNHKVYSASGKLIFDSETGEISAGYEDNIGVINPLRWKSHYYDQESGSYYIEGRYYDPYIMQYIDAEPAENMLKNAYVPNGLDRNAIITYNVIAFMCCMHAIFTTAELYPDPLYDPPLMNWWEKHGKEIFMLLVTAMMIAASIVSSCLFPPAAGGALFGATKTIGSILVGMVTTGAKAALSGIIIGGIMGGLSAALYGGDVWDGIASSAMSGAISGFIVAVAIYAISTIVSTAVQAIRAANAARRATKATNSFSKIKYTDLPDDIRYSYEQYSKSGWKGNYKGQTQGTKAGGTYDNIPIKLPTHTENSIPITYREFDAVNKIAGMSRSAQRFVVSNRMDVYYTSDHYLTFLKIIGD